MSETYLLALDLGTSGPKVALFTTQGEWIGTEFQATPLLLFRDGGAEQSPDDWWNAVDQAMQRLLGRNLVSPERIVGLACTGQWSGTVPVDPEGQPLENAIIWMDSRGAPYVREVVMGPVRIQGYDPLKLMFWIWLTAGAPSLSGKDSLAHILYLKHTRPDLYRRTFKFLEPVDYLGWCLTGRMAASFASIALHWVTNNRNIHAVRYDERLLRWAGLEREKLPELQPANSILGVIRPELARRWGLRSDVRVVIGSPDVQSAAVGSGAIHDFEPHLYIGTSSWLTCHVPFKKADLLHSLATLPSAIPGRYLLTNEQECAGACLQFLRDKVFFAQDELAVGERPAHVYRLFDAMAERAPAGSGRILFLPWLYGERAPIDDRYARGGFFNLSLSSQREHLVRAVFEGVAFNTRWLLTFVESFLGRRVTAVNMVGGGARSQVWCQILADVLNRPIRQMKDPLEVNVRGAALLAAVALGYLSYDQIEARVPVAKTYFPQPQNRAIYDELFGEFVALYRQNRASFLRLNRAG